MAEKQTAKRNRREEILQSLALMLESSDGSQRITTAKLAASVGVSEAALYRHPAVFQCAVVGVPDPKWGEVGKAYVISKPGQSVSAGELLAHLGEHLARYKIPRTIEFVTALPISAAGKMLRRELRER